MAESLKLLIRWPSRDEVRATIPKVFRNNFPRCTAIIDCTIIIIEGLEKCISLIVEYGTCNMIQ